MRALLKLPNPLRALAAAGLIMAPAAAHAANSLRVGKAVPEAFSFVPLDVAVQKGFFKKYGPDVQSIAFAGDAKCSRRWRRTASTLPSGPVQAWRSSSRDRR